MARAAHQAGSRLTSARAGDGGTRSELDWELRIGSSEENSFSVQGDASGVLDELGYEIEDVEQPYVVS